MMVNMKPIFLALFISCCHAAFLDNLGSSISKQLEESLKGLENLGPSIAKNVEDGLKPVREMQFRLRVKYGNGGTTVANVKDKTFVLKNGVTYICDDKISDTDGSCSGNLKKVDFKNKEDFCFAPIKSVINDMYCLGNGNVNSGYINGKMYCESSDNSPTLSISQKEYQELCGNDSNKISYKYYTYEPLGEHGSNVKCTGDKLHICTMEETITNGSYYYAV